MERIYACIFVILAFVETSLVLSVEDGGNVYSALQNSAPRSDSPQIESSVDESSLFASAPSDTRLRNDASASEVVLNKREAFDVDEESSRPPSNSESSVRWINARNENVVCLQSSVSVDGQVLCIEPSNTTRSFYISKRDNRQGNRPDSGFFSRGEGYNHNGNFVRYGRSNFNLFSRYDRGRDNFMRLGRSKPSSEISTRQPVEADTKELTKIQYDRPSRSDNSFLRFGREANPFGHGRFSRKAEHFIRFGRNPDSEAEAPKESKGAMFHCKRCGRNDKTFAREVRNRVSFMRLGRFDSSRLTDDLLGQDEADHIYDRNVRKMDRFLRLGRKFEEDPLDWVEEAKQQNDLVDNGYLNGQVEILPRNFFDEYEKCNYKHEGLLSEDVQKCLIRNDARIRYLRDTGSNSRTSKSPEPNAFGREARRHSLYLRFGRSSEAEEGVSSELVKNKEKRYTPLSPSLRFGRSDKHYDIARRADDYQTSGSYDGDESAYRIREAN